MKKNLLKLILISSSILLLSGCSFSGTIDTDNNVDENNNKQENVVENNNQENLNTVISDDDAYSIGQKLYDFGLSALWNKEYQYSNTSVENLGYEILNYDEVSSKFTNDNQVKYLASASTFKSLDSNLVKNNNKYYVTDITSGRGSDQSYISTKLELVSKEENVITFNAKSGYCINGSIYAGNCNNADEYKTYEFIIEKENNEWKIAKMTLPN